MGKKLFAQPGGSVVNVESTFVSCQTEAAEGLRCQKDWVLPFQTLLLQMNDASKTSRPHN